MSRWLTRPASRHNSLQRSLCARRLSVETLEVRRLLATDEERERAYQEIKRLDPEAATEAFLEEPEEEKEGPPKEEKESPPK